MGLKINRTPGKGVIIGRNSTNITVDMVLDNEVILGVSGVPKRLVPGQSLTLEKGKIVVTLESVTDNRILLNFEQSGEKEDWLSVVRSEKYENGN